MAAGLAWFVAGVVPGVRDLVTLGWAVQNLSITRGDFMGGRLRHGLLSARGFVHRVVAEMFR